MKANTYSRRGGVGGKKASTAPAPADDDSFDDFVVEKKKPSGTGKKKNTCSAKGSSKNDKPQVKSLDYFEKYLVYTHNVINGSTALSQYSSYKGILALFV